MPGAHALAETWPTPQGSVLLLWQGRGHLCQPLTGNGLLLCPHAPTLYVLARDSLYAVAGYTCSDERCAPRVHW